MLCSRWPRPTGNSHPDDGANASADNICQTFPAEGLVQKMDWEFRITQPNSISREVQAECKQIRRGIRDLRFEKPPSFATGLDKHFSKIGRLLEKMGPARFVRLIGLGCRKFGGTCASFYENRYHRLNADWNVPCRAYRPGNLRSLPQKSVLSFAWGCPDHGQRTPKLEGRYEFFAPQEPSSGDRGCNGGFCVNKDKYWRVT